MPRTDWSSVATDWSSVATDWSSVASQPIISIDWGVPASTHTTSTFTLDNSSFNEILRAYNRIVGPADQPPESETALKTVVLSVGEDTTYQIGVTLNEPALVRAIIAANPTVSMIPLVEGRDEVGVRRMNLDGKDCSLAAFVAAASILTGRNILNDGVIPWGSMSNSGQPLANTDPNDRGYGAAIQDRPDLMSFLEPTEFDPSFVRDEPPAVLVSPTTQWVLYGVDCGMWWSDEEEDFVNERDDASVFGFSSLDEMARWTQRCGLGSTAWQMA